MSLETSSNFISIPCDNTRETLKYTDRKNSDDVIYQKDEERKRKYIYLRIIIVVFGIRIHYCVLLCTMILYRN